MDRQYGVLGDEHYEQCCGGQRPVTWLEVRSTKTAPAPLCGWGQRHEHQSARALETAQEDSPGRPVSTHVSSQPGARSADVEASLPLIQQEGRSGR